MRKKPKYVKICFRVCDCVSEVKPSQHWINHLYHFLPLEAAAAHTSFPLLLTHTDTHQRLHNPKHTKQSIKCVKDP